MQMAHYKLTIIIIIIDDVLVLARMHPVYVSRDRVDLVHVEVTMRAAIGFEVRMWGYQMVLDAMHLFLFT